MQMTKPQFEAFRKAMAVAVAPVEEHFGVKIDTDRAAISYTEQSFTIKLEVSNVSETGEDVGAKANFLKYAPLGLHTTFGRSFAHKGGARMTVVGYMPRKRKFPILCREENSHKLYQFPESTVAQYFNRDPRTLHWTAYDANDKMLPEASMKSGLTVIPVEDIWKVPSPNSKE